MDEPQHLRIVPAYRQLTRASYTGYMQQSGGMQPARSMDAAVYCHERGLRLQPDVQDMRQWLSRFLFRYLTY